MARRYVISSQSALLASTYFVEWNQNSKRSIVVETRTINNSTQVPRIPRKIFTMFDRDTETISLFTSPDETLQEPIKIRLSTIRLGPAISRRFSDAGLLTLAVCSSAETAFLAGTNPPEISRSFFFFRPRHGASTVSKNRVVCVESFAQTEVSGLRMTKCYVKKMRKIASGTLLKINRLRQMDNADPIVDYVTGMGLVFKLRQHFVNVLNVLPQPFSEEIECLIEFERFRSVYSQNLLYQTFANYLKGRTTQFMLQWSASFGDEDVMEMLSSELATRINTGIRNGIDAVRIDLGHGPDVMMDMRFKLRICMS